MASATFATIMGMLGPSWGRVGALALALFAPAASAQPLGPATAFTPSRRGTNRWEGSLAAVSVAIAPATPRSDVALSLGAGVAPRAWLGRGFQVRGAFSLSRAFADSDTTTRPKTQVHDPSVDLWFHGIPSFAGFHPAVAVGMVFPLSVESQARTLLLGTQVAAQLAWWRRVSSVTLFARAAAGWEHRFYEYSTPGVRSTPSVRPTCYGESGSGGSCADQLSGLASITDYLWWSLTFAPRWRHFSPGVSFELDRAIPASFSTVVGLSTSASDRYYSSFSTWLEFIPTPPLSVLLSYTLSRPVLDADGTYGNPFWASHKPAVVALTLVLRLDELVAAARGEPAGPGGIVRW
jgi:hypothetical protein